MARQRPAVTGDQFYRPRTPVRAQRFVIADPLRKQRALDAIDTRALRC
jgi:hypothetical protein